MFSNHSVIFKQILAIQRCWQSLGDAAGTPLADASFQNPCACIITIIAQSQPADFYTLRGMCLWAVCCY